MKAAVMHGKVLEGAGPDEQDVFVQAATVAQALSELGYETSVVPFSLNMAETMQALRTLHPDFVFNLVEAVEGMGSMIHCAPVVLEGLNLPYTGAQSEGMFLTSSKITAKKILRAHGIATPDWVTSLDRSKTALTAGRYIVKSAWEDASIGLDEDSVLPAGEGVFEKVAALKRRLGSACFAESFIEGREINVSLLAGAGAVEVLPPAEIVFEDYPPEKIRVLGYRSKWVEESFEYQHTPRTFAFPEEDAALLKKVADIARRAWDIFDLRGYARVDFRVDRSGRPWVLEINANPCLSPEGGFMAASAQAGMGYNEVIARIIGDIPATGNFRHPDKP